MRTAVLTFALLLFPAVILVTVGGMLYAMRDRSKPMPGLQGFAVVGAAIVALTILIPLLILLRVL